MSIMSLHLNKVDVRGLAEMAFSRRVEVEKFLQPDNHFLCGRGWKSEGGARRFMVVESFHGSESNATPWTAPKSPLQGDLGMVLCQNEQCAAHDPREFIFRMFAPKAVQAYRTWAKVIPWLIKPEKKYTYQTFSTGRFWEWFYNEADKDVFLSGLKSTWPAAVMADGRFKKGTIEAIERLLKKSLEDIKYAARHIGYSSIATPVEVSASMEEKRYFDFEAMNSLVKSTPLGGCETVCPLCGQTANLDVMARGKDAFGEDLEDEFDVDDSVHVEELKSSAKKDRDLSFLKPLKTEYTQIREDLKLSWSEIRERIAVRPEFGEVSYKQDGETCLLEDDEVARIQSQESMEWLYWKWILRVKTLMFISQMSGGKALKSRADWHLSQWTENFKSLIAAEQMDPTEIPEDQTQDMEEDWESHVYENGLSD